LPLLLDTHALIWWLAGDRSLSAAATSAVADLSNEVFVSAVSAWEIATKYRIGKLPEA
jgi:PIN domain nuclease of toxin-antitoxin system